MKTTNYSFNQPSLLITFLLSLGNTQVNLVLLSLNHKLLFPLALLF